MLTRHRPPNGAPLCDIDEARAAAGRGEVERMFTVRSTGDGWCVQADGLEGLIFANGAQAERQARRLAQCLAELGNDASVSVYDARDALIGTLRYFGCESPA